MLTDKCKRKLAFLPLRSHRCLLPCYLRFPLLNIPLTSCPEALTSLLVCPCSEPLHMLFLPPFWTLPPNNSMAAHSLPSSSLCSHVFPVRPSITTFFTIEIPSTPLLLFHNFLYPFSQLDSSPKFLTPLNVLCVPFYFPISPAPNRKLPMDRKLYLLFTIEPIACRTC